MKISGGAVCYFWWHENERPTFRCELLPTCAVYWQDCRSYGKALSVGISWLFWLVSLKVELREGTSAAELAESLASLERARQEDIADAAAAEAIEAVTLDELRRQLNGNGHVRFNSEGGFSVN